MQTPQQKFNQLFLEALTDPEVSQVFIRAVSDAMERPAVRSRIFNLLQEAKHGGHNYGAFDQYR